MSLFLAFLLKHWRISAAVAFLVAVAAASYYRGHQAGEASGLSKLARERTERAQELAGIQTATAQAAEKARAAERAVAQSFAKIDQQHREDTDRATATETGLRADLAAERRRLRPEWRCPALPRPADPADGPGRGDDAAELRAESASRIVGNADRCDADLRAWQARWVALTKEWTAYSDSLNP